VAILNFSDRRENAKENDTHIGTIYGMVYLNPLFEIHTAEGVSQNAMDALETLFTANGFRVIKYPGMQQPPEKCGARFVITGQVNKLWTKCFHSAEAEVDFDIKIYDSKLNKPVWTGKIEGYELEDPQKIVGLPGFLNKVLGDAINKAWNENSMRSSFAFLTEEALATQKIQRLEIALKNSPTDAKKLLKLGIEYLDMRKCEKAISTLSKSIDIGPNNPRAH
jgi:tetratricopeptide (TPR) repeat protein